jgi:hypothetical protein
MTNFTFCFKSYGVGIKIESNSSEVLDLAVKATQRALLERTVEISCADATQHFQILGDSDGVYGLFQNGREMATDKLSHKFWKYFDGLVRILVAEFTKEVVIVHAGVVGWHGKAIVVPGDSFFGKTTLIAEFIRSGAEYYSDEYAVFDERGMVHPFERPLAMRSAGPKVVETSTDIAEIGGRVGRDPIPVGVLLFTKYIPESKVNYQFLSRGEAVVRIIGQTIPIRRNSEFAIKVLKNAVSSAIIVESSRSEAREFVRGFLEFVDNTAI